MQEVYHWPALIFVAAVCLQLRRLFFTGAFPPAARADVADLAEPAPTGHAGGVDRTVLPHDMMSGGSPRVLQGVLEAIPLAGTHLMRWVFGSAVPGHPDHSPALLAARAAVGCHGRPTGPARKRSRHPADEPPTTHRAPGCLPGPAR